MSTSNSSEQPPRPPRLKNALKNLALAVTSLLLCFALAEGAFRLLGYGNVEIYEADPLLYWRLKPNQHCYTKVDRKPVRVNSRGTRGPEFVVPKPPNTIRILSLGDSRTFGWGLSEEATYSRILERHVQAALGSRKRVEVINAGVNAWAYPQMTTFFRDHALRWQPDLVILAEGNLWTQFSENADPAFVKEVLRRVRLKNLARRSALYHFVVEVQLKDFYEKHRTRFIPVQPQNDDSFKEHQKKDVNGLAQEAIEQLCALAISNGVQPVLVYMPLQGPLLQPTTNVFTEVLPTKVALARKWNVPLLDLTPDLQPRAAELFLDGDPVHLNAAGNEIVGRRLAEVVTSRLNR
jgi:lysophospholipase L1-like esterase